MPLSEQEQRLLEEMERSLYHNDADVIATVGGRHGKPNYTTVVIGILIGLLGIVTIVTGVIVHQPIVGVLGFGVMFGGVLLAISRPRHTEPVETETGRTSAGPAGRSTLMDRLNERWDRRQDDNQ
ncbi:MAG: DUF3040 domain-containing protein [Microbacteriaceae bacterium]